MGRSTGSEFWAALGGLALGLALSGALRWGPRHRRTREILVPLGLNLGALALLGAVLASGTEPGGLGARWESWLAPFGAAAGVGLLGFRFPRSVGLPLVLAAGAGLWFVVQAVSGFAPLGPAFSPPTVQPLTDREVVTAFDLRVDLVEIPDGLPLVPRTLYRVRSGPGRPAEPWWAWAEARGWARSVGAPVPEHPLKLGVYRLDGGLPEPRWVLVAPELSVPGE